MGIDIDLLPDRVLAAIAYNMGLEKEDLGDEDKMRRVRNVLKNASVEEAMNRYLNWHGILGYTSDIIGALDGIRLANALTKD
jgi:hypothetical protein